MCRKGDNYQKLSQQSQNKFSSEKKKKTKLQTPLISCWPMPFTPNLAYIFYKFPLCPRQDKILPPTHSVAHWFIPMAGKCGLLISVCSICPQAAEKQNYILSLEL